MDSSSYSFDQPLRLTKTSSSINTDPGETDLSDVNDTGDRFTASVTTSTDTDFSWTSRLSYQLHMGVTYKVRKFSSRGALLVLILNFLVSAGYGVPAGNGNAYHFYEDPHSIRDDRSTVYPDEPPWKLRDTIPVIFWFPAILVLGLLADIRFGRRRMVLFGILLLWVAVIADCIRVTVFYYSPYFRHKNELFHTVFLIDAVLSYIATAAFLVNSVQLAIDQLVDASAEQVSSFIQWYMFTYFFGAWVFNQFTQGPLYNCFLDKQRDTSSHTIKVLANLLQVIFVSLALCLVALCGGWIKTIPTRNNPLKLIWQVLRFSANHKYPVSRSALTYWEDEIPSRINLGKDKYGGPFTNEQVEDVKTFFRMLCLGLPCIAMAASGFLVQDNFVYSASQNFSTNTLMDFDYYESSSVGNTCIQSLYAAFLANINLWICVYVLWSELIVYPLISRCIPSMLKRIGLGFFVMMPVSIVLLVLNAVAAFTLHSVKVHRLEISCVITAIAGLQYYLIISSLLEFVCAQSPQSMKGFLIGFMWLVIVLLTVIAYFVYYFWSLTCIGSGCGTGYFSLVVILGVAGFIVYCVVAKWYRHRERDDCPNNQAIVEEVFARRFEYRRKLGIESSSSFVCNLS